MNRKGTLHNKLIKIFYNKIFYKLLRYNSRKQVIANQNT